MNLKIKPANPRLMRNAFRSGHFSRSGIWQLARLVIIDGPRALFAAQLNSRSASFIMLLCMPALCMFMAVTVPPIIFPSADHEAYFYFARTFSQDLSSGFVLGLSALCMFIALALPASSSEDFSAIRR